MKNSVTSLAALTATFLICSFLVTELRAEEVRINSTLQCHTEDGANSTIQTLKKGQYVKTSFSVLLKKTDADIAKAKLKLLAAKKLKKKSLIAKAQLALNTASQLKSTIRKCQKGTLKSSSEGTPTPSPTPLITPTPTPTNTPSGGDVVLHVRAESKLQLFIDPSFGWGQYYGYIQFTDVDSIFPGGPSISDVEKGEIRSACLKEWDAKSATYAAVRIYSKRTSGVVVVLNPPGFWATTTDGNFVSKGFNADPGAEVHAVAGLWDLYYNQRTVVDSIKVVKDNKTFFVDCFVGPEAYANYPL